MGHPISLSTRTGRIGGWRADPPGQPRGALILAQEIFGANAHIRHQVERFAAHGFVCIAPAFFDHLEHHVELGYDEAGVARGRALVAQLSFERVLDDVDAAAREVSGEFKVGIVGYCWGGSVAFLANTRLGLPAVSYYGARTLPFVREPLRAPMQFHFGENDPLIPPDAVAAHREAQPEAKCFVYPAGHGFNCDERADFDAASARLAMERSVAFFTHTLK